MQSVLVTYLVTCLVSPANTLRAYFTDADSEMSSAQISSRSHDSGSDVTLQSHDTWGGLAPQPRPRVIASDVVNHS